MDGDALLAALQAEAKTFTEAVATERGDWIIKGFIDVYRHVYTISVDTKVVSKVLELLLLPKLVEFAARNGFRVVLAPEQNFYPDVTLISEGAGEKYAIDIKSTYRSTANSVNGMTLGAFTGYFRKRNSAKNIVFPYNEYASHLVLGAIYTKTEAMIDEHQIYTIDDLEQISSVIRDFIFFVQPKYRIASALPGSGNTKNIGSVTLIDQLLNGAGPFMELGEESYDDYWMYYLTKDMARALEQERPYHNLATYIEYKNRGKAIPPDQVERLAELDTGIQPGEEQGE